MQLHDIMRRTILTTADEEKEATRQLKDTILEIQNLIKDGADVNALEDGKTPLTVLFERDEVQIRHVFMQSIANNISNLVAFASIELIKNGANPWAGEACTWDIPCPFSPKTLLLNRLQCGPDLTGPGGESDLHAFCRGYPGYSRKLLKLHALKFSSKTDSDRLNRVNDEGLTALHILWQRPFEDDCDREDRFDFT